MLHRSVDVERVLEYEREYVGTLVSGGTYNIVYRKG